MTDTLSRKTSELERLLVRVALEHAPAALASSLSAEDMVVTDAILRHKLGIEGGGRMTRRGCTPIRST